MFRPLEAIIRSRFGYPEAGEEYIHSYFNIIISTTGMIHLNNYQNPSIGSRVVPFGQTNRPTYRHDEVNSFTQFCDSGKETAV